MIGNSIMWSFIDEQPQILKQIHQKNLTIPNINCDSIVISASGSSLNSALIVEYLMQDSDMKIYVVDPFDLRYYEKKYLTASSILIVLSQTGRSTGVLDCLAIAKEKKIPSISFTADSTSPIARRADYHFDVLCGPEPVGPKTKGFTAMTFMLHKFLLKFVNHPESDEIMDEYLLEIDDIQSTIQKTQDWIRSNHDWSKVNNLSIVGFGAGNAVAREGSLKILETLQIPIMNYNLEEFMHGPHRTIVKDSHIVYITQDTEGVQLMNNLIEFTNSITSNLLIVSNSIANEQTILLENSSATNALWINQVVVFQVLCTALPELNGVDPANPVYGSFAKKVGTRI